MMFSMSYHISISTKLLPSSLPLSLTFDITVDCYDKKHNCWGSGVIVYCERLKWMKAWLEIISNYKSIVYIHVCIQHSLYEECVRNSQGVNIDVLGVTMSDGRVRFLEQEMYTLFRGSTDTYYIWVPCVYVFE